MIEVIPLGTGSALPSKDKHFSSIAVEVARELFLFDCGEGTQHQLLHSSLRWSKLKAICITHLHGDHYFGLPGLLSTLSLLRRETPLIVVGPVGIKSFIDTIPSRIPGDERSYEITFVELDHEIGGREVYLSDGCRIVSHAIQHSIPAYGYRLEEKDTPGNLDIEKVRALGIEDFADFRRLKAGEAVAFGAGQQLDPADVVTPASAGAAFAYITDTRPCNGGVELARDAQLVYHEATFIHADLERAIKTTHATALEAAQIAKDAGARQLIIGHFSGRYRDANLLVDEARLVFKNTEAAEELKRYVLNGAVDLVDKDANFSGDTTSNEDTPASTTPAPEIHKLSSLKPAGLKSTGLKPAGLKPTGLKPTALKSVATKSATPQEKRPKPTKE
ncbi:MAG: ribonuclease Z [Rhodothermales bacterium]